MNEIPDNATIVPIDLSNETTTWRDHNKLFLMVALAIAVAAVLTGISLAMYGSSGAAQLDLTRPGYSSVREQAVLDDNYDGFSSSGPINQVVLEEFGRLYSEQAEKATAVDAFGGDVLNDAALGIDSVDESSN